MTEQATAVQRAVSREEIASLIDHCKAGRLFDVKAWIDAGKPVNPPPLRTKGTRHRTPLEWAIDRGFHSLIQVLLEAGAIQEPEGYNAAMYRAIDARRLDIAQLLVEHGFPADEIDMDRVFESWDPEMMEYFIDQGAEIVAGQPFAVALCNRIRTALNVYRRQQRKLPDLQEQADVALRHHCKEGNLKWVSLLLWAGADPVSAGSAEPNWELKAEDEEEEGLSALGWAALYNHYEVFRLKPIRSKLPGPNPGEFLRYLTGGEGVDVLKELLGTGLDPNDQADGGCSVIGSCLTAMGWDWSYSWSGERQRRDLDTQRERDLLKSIHLLAKHGGKWIPEDKNKIDEARRSLLKMIPDYTVEFVWIMAKYEGCSSKCIEQLLRTSAIKRHTGEHRERLDELVASLKRAGVD